jgi:hypothetical protein
MNTVRLNRYCSRILVYFLVALLLGYVTLAVTAIYPHVVAGFEFSASLSSGVGLLFTSEEDGRMVPDVPSEGPGEGEAS